MRLKSGPEPADQHPPANELPETDPAIVNAISRQLRGYYARMIGEPVPDHLLDLVAKLERSVGAEE
jgi:hypothetical protein